VAFPNTGVLANAQGGGHLERLAGVLADTFKTTVRVDGMVDPSAAAATARRSAGDVDTGDAAPDDEAVTTKSALDMVTDALGGTVISESPRA
jgi:hypothetical protein